MIAILDYGVGNLFSLRSSLQQLGLQAVVTADADAIRAADRLIPPGVHGTDVVPGSIQGFQALGSNIRRAHEQNAHQLFPFASRAAFLPSSVSS